MDEVTAKVAGQYSSYPYPAPVADLAASTAEGFEVADPSLFGPWLWPEGRPAGPLHILSAGCGTNQAATLAYTNPGAQVVGVDLSEASLAHQRFLQDKHGLENLKLFQGDLREVGKLGLDFDLIVCSGVLHHLADPGEGLRALKGVLKPDGAMALMVYGAVARAGVYMIQDACRRIGLGRNPEGVAAVRAMLAAAMPTHPVHGYIARAPELEHDEAVVDTFLHPQDRAYTAPQVLEWVEENGLGFQAWFNNQRYYPDALVAEPLRGAIKRLPEPEQWAAVEAAQGIIGKHQFVVRHRGRQALVDFKRPDWPAFRPQLAPGTWLEGPLELRVQELSFALNTEEAATLTVMDGRLSIAEIMDLPAFAPYPAADREAFARIHFERMWKVGALMFETPRRA